jgi:predicted metal-dependent hydrolase
VATDGKNAAAAGMVCPKCGVSLYADVTIREAEELLHVRRQAEAVAKARLDEAERQAREEQRVLDEMRQKVRESQVRAAQCEADWRHSQELVARMAAEVDMLRAETAAAR